MATQSTRNLLASVYKSKAWQQRVNNMTDAQVAAIYLRLRKQGKVS
jgi:hypothetical protein